MVCNRFCGSRRERPSRRTALLRPCLSGSSDLVGLYLRDVAVREAVSITMVARVIRGDEYVKTRSAAEGSRCHRRVGICAEPGGPVIADGPRGRQSGADPLGSMEW